MICARVGIAYGCFAGATLAAWMYAPSAVTFAASSRDSPSDFATFVGAGLIVPWMNTCAATRRPAGGYLTNTRSTSLPPTQKPWPLTIERTFSLFATTFWPGEPASLPLGESGRSCCLPALSEPLGGAFFVELPPTTRKATIAITTTRSAPSTHFSHGRRFLPPPSSFLLDDSFSDL